MITEGTTGELCVGCFHLQHFHVRNIHGDVICTCVVRGREPGGVLIFGNCDCVNHHSRDGDALRKGGAKK